MKSNFEHLLGRFRELREFYEATLQRVRECDTPEERRCVLQEMRAITDEAKSVAREYRECIDARTERTAEA